MTWAVRAVGRWRQWLGYEPVAAASVPRRMPAAVPPRLVQPKPVNRPPRVDLAPLPLPGGVDYDKPWCWCGRTWSDTPQGWAAFDRHKEADLHACAEAFRQRERDRARRKRQAIKADPVLAEQQRVYYREMEKRRLERQAAGQMAPAWSTRSPSAAPCSPSQL